MADRGRADGAGVAPGSLTALGLLTLLLRRRRLLIGLPLGVAAAALGLSFLVGKQFAAESRFMPEQDTQVPSEVAGLAAQFGMAAGGAQESLDFYVELIRTHDLLREAVLTEYEVPIDEGRDTLRGNLLALYEIDDGTPEQRLKAGVQQLRNTDVMAYPRRSANLVELRTLAPWPELAERLNMRILELVNEFNLERRQSRALEERQFLEARFAQAQEQLRDAEDELETFLSRNRRYSESPETQFQHSRLQRQVSFLQQILTSRAQNLEQARVEAVRNTPVITVVDGPRGTALQTAPKPLVNAVLGLVLGFALAATWLLISEMLRSARASRPEDYSELSEVTRETLDGLTPRRLVARRRDRDVHATVPAGVTEEPER